MAAKVILFLHEVGGRLLFISENQTFDEETEWH